MKFFLLILLFILITPLPIKISISWTKENYYIKIYKFNILKKKAKNSCKEKNKKREEVPDKGKKNSKKNNFKLSYIKEIIKALNNNPFKPKLKLKGSFQYSLNDACKTAVYYGMLQSIAPYILEAFKIPFKIKSFNLFIKPIFKDEFIGNFQSSCIIFISIGKAIIMICLILKAVINERKLNIKESLS